MSIFQRFTDDETYEAWRLLDHTRKLIFQLRSNELKAYDVTPVDISLLNRIQTLGDKAHPITIARMGGETRFAVHEMLKKMERKGFISKHHQGSQSRKAMILVLTDKGKKAYEQAKKAQSIHDIFSCLTQAEIRQLDIFLNKLWSKGNQINKTNII